MVHFSYLNTFSMLVNNQSNHYVKTSTYIAGLVQEFAIPLKIENLSYQGNITRAYDVV